MKNNIKITEFTICLHCGSDIEVVNNQMKLLKPLEKKYDVYWNNRIHRYPYKYDSYSKLINHSISTSPTEWIIFINDRSLPTVENVEKIINLLENGFSCAMMWSVAFMGFSKELVRKIGWWDERFIHAGWEDRDWVWRIHLNNLSLYESQESTYVHNWKTPLTASSYDGTAHWYSKYDQSYEDVIYKMIGEEKYDHWDKCIGESIPEISNSWNTWNDSKLDIMFYHDIENPLERSGSSMLKGRKIIEKY